MKRELYEALIPDKYKLELEALEDQHHYSFK